LTYVAVKKDNLRLLAGALAKQFSDTVLSFHVFFELMGIAIQQRSCAIAFVRRKSEKVRKSVMVQS
jgi:hypothetical protein